MKQSIKKLISLVLVLTLSLAISLPTFAQENFDQTLVKDSSLNGYKDSNVSSASYISVDDATLLANQCIKNQVRIDKHCSWNSSTKIKECVSLFDFDNNVNAFLFRLSGNGKKTGYVLVNAYVEAPSVEAFGYDCDYMLDSQNTGKKITTEDHIILADDFTFLKFDKSNNQYTNLENKSQIKETKQELKKSYTENLKANVDTKAQANLQSFKTNALINSSLSQVIYSQHDLSGIWSWSPDQIFVTGDFTGYSNHCSPTAGTNLMYYWAHYGNPKQPSLWTGSVFKDLYKYMKTNNGQEGTNPTTDIQEGLEQYASSRKVPVTGSNINREDWESLTVNLNGNTPVIITVEGDPKYKNHTMLAVGYQDTSTGQYIRVANGWDKNFKNFYKYPSHLELQISVWW